VRIVVGSRVLSVFETTSGHWHTTRMRLTAMGSVRRERSAVAMSSAPSPALRVMEQSRAWAYWRYCFRLEAEQTAIVYCCHIPAQCRLQSWSFSAG